MTFWVCYVVLAIGTYIVWIIFENEKFWPFLIYDFPYMTIHMMHDYIRLIRNVSKKNMNNDLTNFFILIFFIYSN